MAVVIRDFEAVAEAEAPAAASAAREQPPRAESVDRAAVERALQQSGALRLRRWAH